jgi:hypothetical protein
VAISFSISTNKVINIIMRQMKVGFYHKISFCILCVILSTQVSVAQGIELKIDLKNYKSDTLIIGNYYGEKQIVKDTLVSKDHSKFVWKEERY